MDSNIERVERLTLELWDRLPWLLPRATVLEWTGLSPRELEEEVRAGRLRVWRSRRKRKWYKTEVAILAGIVATPHRISANRGLLTPIESKPLDRASAS